MSGVSDAEPINTESREELARRLEDLGKKIVIDQHGFWAVPDGWTEESVLSLASEVGVNATLLGRLAMLRAGRGRSYDPGSTEVPDVRVPRPRFSARDEAAELKRLRLADRQASTWLKAIHCRRHGCRRLIARVRPNPDASGGVEFVLIGPVSLDPNRRRYVYGAGRSARASDVHLHGVGVGLVDADWKVQVECSCGQTESLLVGQTLQALAGTV